MTLSARPDPTVGFAIRYVAPPTAAVPVARLGRERGEVGIGGVVIAAALAIGVAVGMAATGSHADPARVNASFLSQPAPGEFRLGPGNLTPPGVVVTAPSRPVVSVNASDPAPGEFRLGPGNLTPPGIVVPGE